MRESSTVFRHGEGRTPAGREAKQPTVDARSFGASPEGAPGPLLIRKMNENPIFQSRDHRSGNGVQSHPNNDSDNFRWDSSDGRHNYQQRPPSERSIFQSRGPPSSNVQSLPNNDPNNFRRNSFEESDSFQQRSPRDQSARYNKEESAHYSGAQKAKPFGQAHRTLFPKGHSSFQKQGEGRPPQLGRSQAGRSRSARTRNDGRPRRRNRDAENGIGENDRRRHQREPLTEEEQKYMKEKTERKSPKDIKFEPVEFSRETFNGMGSTTGSDEWGMSELLGGQLVLARKYLDREFIQWDSKQHKADVMAVAEKLRAVRTEGKTNGEGKKAKKDSPMSGNGDQQAQALMQKLLAGEYAMFKRLGARDVLGHVERQVHRNETFYPDDEKSLLEKVKSIMPAERASNTGRRARNEVTV